MLRRDSVRCSPQLSTARWTGRGCSPDEVLWKRETFVCFKVASLMVPHLEE